MSLLPPPDYVVSGYRSVGKEVKASSATHTVFKASPNMEVVIVKSSFKTDEDPKLFSASTDSNGYVTIPNNLLGEGKILEFARKTSGGMERALIVNPKPALPGLIAVVKTEVRKEWCFDVVVKAQGITKPQPFTGEFFGVYPSTADLNTYIVVEKLKKELTLSGYKIKYVDWDYDKQEVTIGVTDVGTPPLVLALIAAIPLILKIIALVMTVTAVSVAIQSVSSAYVEHKKAEIVATQAAKAEKITSNAQRALEAGLISKEEYVKITTSLSEETKEALKETKPPATGLEWLNYMPYVIAAIVVISLLSLIIKVVK